MTVGVCVAADSDYIHQFPLSISLVGNDSGSSDTNSLPPTVSSSLQSSFDANGFVILENVLDSLTVRALNDRLEEVLRGRHDRGGVPDKQPKLLKGEVRGGPRDETAKTKDIRIYNSGTNPSKMLNTDNKSSNNGKKSTKNVKKPLLLLGPLGFSGNLQNVKVMQIINIHKSDKLFRALATCAGLGKVVAELAGWKCGARLAQDQIWAKPPGAASLVFHRDCPYFMFTPSQVVTVWIALDDMDEELGPLEYVRGSHLWGDGRLGSCNQFFESRNSLLLKSAAEREGLSMDDLNIVSTAGLKAGGLSIHNGKTWHGSAKNKSPIRPRRGVGLHFVPAEVRFTNDAKMSRLWKPYVDHVEDASQVELPQDDFPITWQPSM